MQKDKLKKRKKVSVFDITNIFLLLVLTFIFTYPIYYTVIASFSDYQAVATGKVGLLPVGFQLTAYKAILENTSIWAGYRNTILYTVGGTFFNILLTIPSAYVLSKKQLLGRKVVTWFFLITMYFSGGMVPTYLLYKNIGLVNNPLIMVVAGGLSVYNLIVSRTYFANSIPESLYEAGEIDGGSEITLFVRIAMPLAKPIVAVMTLYYAVGHWNSYFTALLYLTQKAFQPLALVLRRILIMNEAALDSALSSDLDPALIANAAARSNLVVTMKYGLVLIASLPMLILYPFIQRYFVKGVMIGSVKE
ncbi:MAG: carbohydrate ABC transporter permease [Butyrivibrio sp.]|nr:carbohydrate ABC transporter permease [Butyrivibrio sp.]